MSLKDDARAFGQHFKWGVWRLRFVVARSRDPSSKGRFTEKTADFC